MIFNSEEKKMSRKVAREIGLKILFQIDFHKESIDDQIELFLNNTFEEMEHDDKPLKNLDDNDKLYIRDVSKGSVSKLQEIDQKIEQFAKGWTVDRIAKVDIAILRLAMYEILYRNDIPNEVSINEAVELAKKYSTGDSGAFINGILGQAVK